MLWAGPDPYKERKIGNLLQKVTRGLLSRLFGGFKHFALLKEEERLLAVSREADAVWEATEIGEGDTDAVDSA